MKNIEDYYWVAKDENEKYIITRLLGLKVNKDTSTYRDLDMDYPIVRIDRFEISANRRPSNDQTRHRTESTLEELLEWARKGFDLHEPWEIPEDGFKIVSDKEREENDHPTDIDVRYYHYGMNEWRDSSTSKCWNPHEEQCYCKSFAVPVSYEFGPQRVKVVCEGKETWISKEDAQTLNLCD